MIKEWVRERLEWENWEAILPRAIQFAKSQIKRRYWRGTKGGSLPEGQDANGVASEVVAAVLAGKCQLALGWTRERLEREIQRRISNEIRRLYALKETAGTRNEWDILGVEEDQKLQTIFHWIPGSLEDGREAAATNEEDQEREGVKKRLEARLGADEKAKGVLNCLCDGVVKRREIAARLGISVQAVTAARKRLERKVKEYRFKSRLMRADS